MLSDQTCADTLCEHNSLSTRQGLALISVGNQLRSDDGIAFAICSATAKMLAVQPCRFDLGSYTNYLPYCLAAHKAAIIVDATKSGAQPGTTNIVDLNAIASTASPMPIESCHGFSLVDEIRLLKRYTDLPLVLIFFGVEVSENSWQEQLSLPLEKKLPELTAQLYQLITSVWKAMEKNA
jgi:hydrogenase maturation protease